MVFGKTPIAWLICQIAYNLPVSKQRSHPMHAEILEPDLDTEHPLLEPGEQRPDEPDRWYRRFQRYCQLGPGRSLLRCYQLVMDEKDSRAQGGNGTGPRRTPRRSHTPAIWRRYADQFEWDQRARAYDQAQNQQVEHAMQHILHSASRDLEEMRQFYLDLMHGWIRSPQGEMVPVNDIYQRRMAAKDYQNLLSMLRTNLAGGEQFEEIDQVEIREILAHQPQQAVREDPHGADQAPESHPE
jgi:hypothetical protein